jgi:DNA-binding HxlR family transcriptional regulator
MDANQENTSCDAACPVRKTADILDHKWVTLIVRDLLTGAKRYSELAQSLAGISPKVLSDRLQQLERQGLLTRTVFPTVPPSTEYALTPLGQQLEGVIRAMQEFGSQLSNQEPLTSDPDTTDH